MTYNNALDYLDKLGVFGIKPGLERITILLELLDNPQLKYKTIHITGTNGKGSVTSMVAQVLECSAFKTGKFTSPHLVRHNERIAINGVDISDDDFTETLQIVAAANEKMQERLQDTLTQFEFLTAMAFLYFAKQAVDYAVIEVGLGGRWDSTNVLAPALTIITNVELDHTDRLGNSIVEIATDKSGIMRENIPMITGAENDALPVIRKFAKELHSPLLILEENFSTENYIFDKSKLTQTFTFVQGNEREEYSIKLIGKHQIKNASLAVMALKVLMKSVGQINSKTIRLGLAQTTWAGRIEIVANNPLVILDGAHNVHGARALRVALEENFSGKKLCLIVGMMRDKNIKEVLAVLTNSEYFCIATIADPSMPRSASTLDIEAHSTKSILQEPNLLAAILKAKEIVGTSGVICICGSLYLVGRAKKAMTAIPK